MDHLAIVVIMALVAQGAFLCMAPDMALHWFSKLVKWPAVRFAPKDEAKKKEWFKRYGVITSPISTCPRCMVSVWGSAACFALEFPPPPHLWYLPVYWLCAAGLQELMQR